MWKNGKKDVLNMRKCKQKVKFSWENYAPIMRKTWRKNVNVFTMTTFKKGKVNFIRKHEKNMSYMFLSWENNVVIMIKSKIYKGR